MTRLNLDDMKFTNIRVLCLLLLSFGGVFMAMGCYKLRKTSLVIYFTDCFVRIAVVRDCYRTMKMIDSLHFETRTSRSIFRMANSNEERNFVLQRGEASLTNYFAKCFFFFFEKFLWSPIK